jgi:hypothetical protein
LGNCKYAPIFRVEILPICNSAWNDGWNDGWKDGWNDGWNDGWKDGWNDGWKDEGAKSPGKWCLAILPVVWWCLLNDIDQRLRTVKSFDPLMWLKKLAVWQL